MGVRADWHIDLSVTDDDPFETLPIEQVGTPIDLSKSPATLLDEVTLLLGREGRLYNAGVTCALKERDDTCCSVCPVAEVGTEKAALCEVGKEQERVLTAMAVETMADGG